MAGYCLKNGRIQEAWGEDAAGRELAAVFHLTADGEMKELHEFPALSEGEGALAYAGEFYIEPLEVQIEFLKAANAEKWLEALLLRHVDRVRQVSDWSMFVSLRNHFGILSDCTVKASLPEKSERRHLRCGRQLDRRRFHRFLHYQL